MAVTKPTSLLLLLISILSILGPSACDDAALQQKCGEEFPKVASCLDYATGKANAPTPGCCTAVTSIQDADEVCLCFIIQQTHNGNPSVKSLGVQFDKLLALPTACSLKIKLSDCPGLLNITKSSPDYSIFTANATTPGTSAGTSPSSADATTPSGATVKQIRLLGTVAMAVISAVFLSFFSLGA